MRRLLSAAVLVSIVACSGGDAPSAPAVALTVETSVRELSATVSAVVGSVPSVTVTNARGEAVSGVLVRWNVLSGNGSVGNETSRTDASGLATSGGWTLGPQVGVQQLQASVNGSAPVVFTANAIVAQATRLVAVTATLPTVTVGTATTASPSVRAEDASGRAVANVPVTFSVVAGGGTVSTTQATTNASGVASAGTWTLGTRSGTQTVRATSGTLTTADVSITAKAAAPATMSIVAGDNQSAAPGSVVSQPPVVRITDSYGNNVGNVPVTFAPGSGSGSVTGGTVQTDVATGTAVVSSWTLGTAPAQTLVASSSAMPGKSVTFRATISSSQFDIDVRFIGDGGTARQREAFASAVARWRKVITGDVGTTTLKTPEGECASWIPAINENVNDLVIYVRLSAIDGAGKVLGQASPCYLNSQNNLPIMGFFELDVDDLALLLDRDMLDNVVLHEMGHILGIGTLWTYQRTLLSGRGTEDPFFTGVSAGQQFASLGGVAIYPGGAVPVENSGSAGTRDAHWRRSVFSNELMQGYAQPGGMPMSRVTVASLSDMGYTVTFAGSDSYAFFPALRTLPSGAAVSLGDDIARSALWAVDRNGSRRRVRNFQ